MKKTVRKVALLSMVLVLILGLCMPAFAAYPRVTLYSRPYTARRGYYMSHTYYLNCNSNTYRGGYRANYDGFIYRRATGSCYWKWDWYFTGRYYHKLNTPVTYSWPVGAYRTYVRTYCRPYGYGRWSFVRAFNWYFNVR